MEILIIHSTQYNNPWTYDLKTTICLKSHFNTARHKNESVRLAK